MSGTIIGPPSRYDACACGNRKATAAKKCRDCWKTSPRQLNRATCRSGRHLWCSDNVRVVNNIQRCVPCMEEYNERSREASRQRSRVTTLRKYNLTLDQFEALVQEQGNCCAACRDEFTETPHIDHDHKCCSTKKRSCGSCIRGLLCSDCNRGIGVFKDDPTRLRKAAEYLER